jgi:putative membrane protein
MALTFQQTVGLALVCVIILIHLVLIPVIEIILFPHNKDVQKIYLKANYGSPEAMATAQFILLNLGFYNIICALATMYAVYADCVDLLRPLMYIFIGNGVVLMYQSLENYFGAIARAVPAIVALSYLQFLPKAATTQNDMPYSVVLIPIILHVVFFFLESIMFPTSKFVQKMFIGRAATSPMAVDSAKPILFCQGFYNLFIAAGATYALVVAENITAVRCFMIIIVGASLVLVISAPKLKRAALIQGGPALFVLYVLYSKF